MFMELVFIIATYVINFLRQHFKYSATSLFSFKRKFVICRSIVPLHLKKGNWNW